MPIWPVIYWLANAVRIITYTLQLLALGAEVAATVSNGEALDGRATNRAWLAAAVSYTEVGLGGAPLTVRAFVGVNAGAFAVYG